MELNELKPCPFCGGKAEVHKCRLYLDDAVRVICVGCGVATPKVLANHLLYSGGEEIYITEQQAIQEALDRWNRRANDGKS